MTPTNCGCVDTYSGEGNPTTSALVTYNGASLCTGLSTGTLNDILVSIAEYACSVQSQITALTLPDTKITLTTIGSDCIASALGANPTLHELWLLQNNRICSLITSLGALTTDDIVVDGWPDTGFVNCVSIADDDTITKALYKIVSYFCGEDYASEADFYATGKYASPLLPYYKTTPTLTNASGGGVARVTIAAQDYWCDGVNITKAGETINLGDSADNYIYLNETLVPPAIINFAYSVSSVGIGASAPTTTGVQIFKVRTGTGTVTSITNLLDIYPINNTILADDSIKARNIYSDVVYTGGGLKQETGGGLSVYPDGVGIEVATSKVALKDDGVTALKLNADVVYPAGGLKQETTGALSASLDLTSIGLTAGTYKLTSLQLEPGAGTSSLKQVGGGGTAAGPKSASFNAGASTNPYSFAVNNAETKADYSFGSGAGKSIHKYSRVLSSPAQIAAGGNQKIEVGVTGQTTDATPTILTIDGADKITIPTDCICRFKIEVTAGQHAGSSGTIGDGFGRSYEGVIKNVSGTCALISTVVSGTAINNGAFAGNAAVTANNTAKSLDITVTGEANKTIVWHADVTFSMVGFNAFSI